MAFPSMYVNYQLCLLKSIIYALQKRFFSVKLSETTRYLITLIGVFVFSWLGRGIQDPTIKEAEGKASSINNGSLIQGRALYYRSSSWNRACDIDSAKKTRMLSLNVSQDSNLSRQKSKLSL